MLVRDFITSWVDHCKWLPKVLCVSNIFPLQTMSHTVTIILSLKHIFDPFAPCTQTENIFKVFENRSSTILVKYAKLHLPLPLLPLSGPNHLSGITSHYISSNIICSENHHLSFFCLILLKLRFDCFFPKFFFFFNRKFMLHKLIAHAYFLSSIIHNRLLGSDQEGRRRRRERLTPSAPLKRSNMGM